MRLLTEKLQHYYFQTYIFHRYRFQFFFLLFSSNRICTSVSSRHFIFNANLFIDIRFQNNILDYSISIKRILQIIELVYYTKTFKKNQCHFDLFKFFFPLILLIRHVSTRQFYFLTLIDHLKITNQRISSCRRDDPILIIFLDFSHLFNDFECSVTTDIKHSTAQSFYSTIFNQPSIKFTHVST